MIIDEASSGQLSQEDIFKLLIFLTFFHGLFEETFLMMMLGGNFWIVLVGRFCFTLVISYAVIRTFKYVKQTRYRGAFLRRTTSH